ncbi:MAG TPA: hypothetical protein VFB89_00555 [Gemmatimonadales bacterium]|nr:hypothetical protein [Gemmatimonadales bacterium]
MIVRYPAVAAITLLMGAGCAHYTPAPLDPAATAQAYNQRRLDAPELTEWLQVGQGEQHEPLLLASTALDSSRLDNCCFSFDRLWLPQSRPSAITIEYLGHSLKSRKKRPELMMEAEGADRLPALSETLAAREPHALVGRR